MSNLNKENTPDSDEENFLQQFFYDYNNIYQKRLSRYFKF